jgi:hypothetical protein
LSFDKEMTFVVELHINFEPDEQMHTDVSGENNEKWLGI